MYLKNDFLELKSDKISNCEFSTYFMELYSNFGANDTSITKIKELDEYYSLIFKKLNLNYSVGKIINFTNFRVKSNKKIVIGYSSGIDSTYHALKMRDDGYDVTLLHFRNLNKSYPDEKTYADNFANRFDFPIIYIDCKHFDTEQYVDNPVKNHLILATCVDYALEHDISNVGIGNSINNSMNHCSEQFTISDAYEPYLELSLFFKDKLNIELIPIKNSKFEIYSYIYTNNIQQYFNSCISPYRFKNMLNKNNSKKFNIDIPKGHCGSCYKCCQEYICLNEQKLVEHNNEYLIHCANIIKKYSKKDENMYGDLSRMNWKEIVKVVVNDNQR